jgi:hypothetical protein
MARHMLFHGETETSAEAAGDAIDAYYNHAEQSAALNHAIDGDKGYTALRWIIGKAIAKATEAAPTVASLDSTDDSADWLTIGHVLDREEVAYLRSLILPEARTTAKE